MTGPVSLDPTISFDIALFDPWQEHPWPDRLLSLRCGAVTDRGKFPRPMPSIRWISKRERLRQKSPSGRIPCGLDLPPGPGLERQDLTWADLE